MTDPTKLTRHPERAVTERLVLDQILDTGMVGVLATVVAGEPIAVPMLYARDGDRIILHGSTGAGALRLVAAEAPLAFCVTHLDGLVVAHTTFESSANYRSAVIRGQAEKLTESEKAAALDIFSDFLYPGRTSEVRPMKPKETAATLAMALPITADNWLVKTRTGWADEPEIDEPAAWSGVVPIVQSYGEPETAPWAQTEPVPASVQRLLQK